MRIRDDYSRARQSLTPLSHRSAGAAERGITSRIWSGSAASQGRRCLATPGWAPGAFLPVFGRPRAAHPGRRTSQRLSPAPAGPARTPHSLTALAAD